MDDRTSPRLLRNDLDRFRLRSFLESLLGTDEFEIQEESVALAGVAPDKMQEEIQRRLIFTNGGSRDDISAIARRRTGADGTGATASR